MSIDSSILKAIRLISAAFILTAMISSCSTQSWMKPLQVPENGLTIAFYNAENLFDTIDDPSINDKAYLPDSEVPWNTERYFSKLDNLGRVIAAMDTLDFPHLLGLCEVENQRVLDDLRNNQFIKKADYEVIHHEGPDRRGIDVAMLYRPRFFKPLHTSPLKVQWEGMGRSIPRDILYVKGIVASKDTLHLFVNHWSSRMGGQEQSEHLRIGQARFLRSIVDSLLAINRHSNIIMMGDFNDNPDDASLFAHLKAYAPHKEIREGQLFNLAMEPFLLGEGTLYYRGWDFFDQIIVSSNLLEPQQGNLKAAPIEVIKKHWMLFTPRTGVARPNRTATSKSYFGGFSDHLPVMTRISFEEQQ
jgi:hypothetical protein